MAKVRLVEGACASFLCCKFMVALATDTHRLYAVRKGGAGPERVARRASVFIGIPGTTISPYLFFSRAAGPISVVRLDAVRNDVLVCSLGAPSAATDSGWRYIVLLLCLLLTDCRAGYSGHASHTGKILHRVQQPGYQIFDFKFDRHFVADVCHFHASGRTGFLPHIHGG
jgi:hypothetical protein